jgi:hypothetical protein
MAVSKEQPLSAALLDVIWFGEFSADVRASRGIVKFLLTHIPRRMGRKLKAIKVNDVE